MHPNAGARLRSEILLLPKDLTNPGCNNCDSDLILSSVPNDGCESTGSMENSAGLANTFSGANPSLDHRYFMLPGNDNGAKPGTDPLHGDGPSQPADTASADSPARSSSDQAPGDSVSESSAAMALASPLHPLLCHSDLLRVFRKVYASPRLILMALFHMHILLLFLRNHLVLKMLWLIRIGN